MNVSDRLLTTREYAYDKSSYRVTINVSGKRFSAKLKSLQKYPNTLLGSNFLALFYDHRKNEYFFDRDPELFRFIFNFYRRGKLHVSDVDCLEAFRDEVDYFGIPHSAVDNCCWNIFNKLRNTSNEFSIAKNVLERSNKSIETVGRTSKISKTGHICNTFYSSEKPFEENDYKPKDSNLQAVYTRKGRRKDGAAKPYFVTPRKRSTTFQIKNDRSICRMDEFKNVLQYFYALLILASAACNAIETVDCRAYTKCGDYYTTIFFTMETFFATVFTADYIIRFLVSKQKYAFLKEILNIVDLISILPYYLELMSTFLIGASDVMIMFRILRVLRLMKLTRNSLRLQTFLLTLRNCASDLFFLYLMCSFGILLFGGVMYYVEKDSNNAGNFTSIPHSLWFTCVTMVTTGYGDVVPVTMLGKIIAALCGFCGVLIMSLPIPIMQDKKATIVTQP